MITDSITIPFSKDENSIDFNLLTVPTDMLLSLIGSLKTEFTNRQTAIADLHFKQERAAYIDTSNAINKEKGIDFDVKQMFLDFKDF